MSDKRMNLRRVTTTIAAGAVVCLAAASAHATVTVAKDLTPTSVDANAKGKAKLSLKNGAKGKFQVKASHLAPNHSFDVIVHGVKVGTLQTTPGGSGRASFSTKPGAHDSLLGFDPRGSVVGVRDASTGDDDLVGDIPDDTVDPNAVACCLTDHEGEAECEDLLAADCATAGGTTPMITNPDGSQTPIASCLPDPCGGSPAPTTVCCTNQTGDDESESECEDDATDCSAAGGMVVQATSCDPNPCTATPPSTDTACCVTDPESGEVECEVTSPESCTAQNGTPPADGSTTCSTDPCGTGSGDGGSTDDGSSGGDN